MAQREISQADDATLYEFGSILDMVERLGELPRSRSGGTEDWVSKHGSVTALTTALHLTYAETCAFVILLVRLTGENGSTITAAPAAHHRPDGGAADTTASAQVDLSKARRGPRRYMTATLSDVPTWAALPEEAGPISGHDELHTPFGVYMLALELGASSRRILGSDRLLTYWIPKGGQGAPAGRNIRESRGRTFRDRLPQSAVGAWGASLMALAEIPQ